MKFYNGSQKYMYCSPIGVNNWMLLTVTPASVIEDKINMVLNKTYLLGILLIANFFIVYLAHYAYPYPQSKGTDGYCLC